MNANVSRETEIAKAQIPVDGEVRKQEATTGAPILKDYANRADNMMKMVMDSHAKMLETLAARRSAAPCAVLMARSHTPLRRWSDGLETELRCRA